MWSPYRHADLGAHERHADLGARETLDLGYRLLVTDAS